MAELLSQEELDALLLSADELEEEDLETGSPEEVRPYDFFSQERVSRGRMPTLEMVNERFSRYFRTSMFSLMRQPAEVSLNGVQMIKFSEYVNTLMVPTSLNLIRFRPLKGIALITLEAKLVFILVDNFFGGDGHFNAKIEGREFTPTEQRIIQLLLNIIFSDYKESWQPVMDTELEYIGSEFNPEMANIVSPSDVVVINSFHIEMDGGGGDFHITMPYGMIEPIRELLDAGLQTDIYDNDVRWSQSLEQELMDVDVAVEAKLLEQSMMLRDVMELKVGDVIPVDMPEHIVMEVEALPSFRCKLGKSHDHLALKVDEVIPRPEMITSELLIPKSAAKAK